MAEATFSLDLHVLSPPLTFALSQDQTLQLNLESLARGSIARPSHSYVYRNPSLAHSRARARNRRTSRTRIESPVRSPRRAPKISSGFIGLLFSFQGPRTTLAEKIGY